MLDPHETTVVSRWDAWHLHVADAGPEAADQVVRGVVAPAVAWHRAHQAPAAWFFVRYWQYGPHVRFRLGGLDERGRIDVERLLCDHLAEVLAALPASLSAAEYRRQAAPLAAAGEGGRRLDVGTLWPPGVYRCRYDAEISRFGGPGLLAESEALFEAASELALAFCRLGAPEPARSGLGLRATWAALEVLGGDRRLAFCRRAVRNWQSWADAGGGLGDHTVPALPEGVDGPPPAPVRRWVERLGRAMVAWEASLPPAEAERILHAHLHLLHNRLGLGVVQECNHYRALEAALTSRPVLAGVTR